jgi:hypothetical protein
MFALVQRDVGGGSLLQVVPMFSADVISSGLGASNLRLASCQDRLADPRVDRVVRSLYASTQAPKTKPKPSAATTDRRRGRHPRRTHSHHWSDGQGDESAP